MKPIVNAILSQAGFESFKGNVNKLYRAVELKDTVLAIYHAQLAWKCTLSVSALSCICK